MPGSAATGASRPTVSAADAASMLGAAVAEAGTMGVPVTIVVVDESGVLKAMVRQDGAPLVSIETATNKAYAAAAIGMPPDDFYAAIEADGAAEVTIGGRPFTITRAAPPAPSTSAVE